ncbi:MAG: ribosome maturation factor RimP [Zetaproteobacteria bacterium]|nr:ribosome maturation factor RimP [Pseudobdellovibrionaceae bacterium]
MRRDQLDNIIELITPHLPAGYDCIDLEWVQSEMALRVYIDKQDSSVVLSDCQTVSHALEEVEALDDFFTGAWRLEVSSPGVERPLRTAEHFESYLGKEISVKLTEKVQGRKNGSGLLQRLEAGEVFLQTPEGDWCFHLDKLLKANAIYDWNG